MGLTKRWSEHDCLSQIVLMHALRQANVSLTSDVRQIRTKSEEIEPTPAIREEETR